MEVFHGFPVHRCLPEHVSGLCVFFCKYTSLLRRDDVQIARGEEVFIPRRPAQRGTRHGHGGACFSGVTYSEHAVFCDDLILSKRD